MGRETPRNLVAIVVSALLLAACGGTSAEVSAFCESFVAGEQLVSAGPGEDAAAWAEDVTTALDEIEETAPDEVSGAVGTIVGAIRPAIEAGDEEAMSEGMESQAFAEAAQVVDSYLIDECGWETADVTAVDYAFEAELDGLQPGITGLTFENAGTEMHEMILFRFNDDTTESIDELFEMPEEEAMSKVSMRGAVFGAPGDTDTLFVDLDEGRYAIVCFLPVGATPENMEALEAGEVDGPPHFTQGMLREFTIGG